MLLNMLAAAHGAKAQISEQYYGKVTGLTKRQADEFKQEADKYGFLLCGTHPIDGAIKLHHNKVKVVSVVKDTDPVDLFFQVKEGVAWV